MITRYNNNSIATAEKGKIPRLSKTLFIWILLLHSFGVEAATHRENRYSKPETGVAYAATTANNTTTDKIPLDNGTYQVTFLFSYFSKSVFSDKVTILAEKEVLIDDLRNERPDKPCKSFSLTHTIQVSDGMLDIDYMNQAIDVKLGMIIKKTSSTVAAPKAPVAQAPAKKNGLKYRYYEGAWSQIPSFGKLVAKKEGIVSNFTLSPRARQDYFGFEFVGSIQISQSGTYTFYTAADDGSMVYINANRVVNNDRAYGMQEKSGKVYLTKGRHLIRVKYFERTGGEKLTVQYAGPGISKKPIPDEVLFPEEAATSQPERETTPASVEEAVYQINFNANAADSHKNWNNFSSKPTTGSKITSLKNSKGQKSAVSVRLTSNWTGDDNRGYSSQKEEGIYPDAVTRSYFWSRNQETVEISGLNAGKQYDFTFYASSAYNQNRTTDYTINGKKVSLDASLNRSKTVTLSKVQPDKSGKVTLGFAPGKGSAYAIISAMVIETAATSTARIGSSGSENMAWDASVQVEPALTDDAPEAAAPTLTMYPNPVSQVLYVAVSEQTQYALYNARGEEVASGDHTGIGTLEIITSHLKQGLYHLHLTAGQQRWVKTIMVKH